MKSVVNILFVVSFCLSYSQTNFDKMPVNAKEIHFVYEKKSKYLIDENGVYADSILFAMDFPKLKPIKRVNPKDPTQVLHYVSFKNMSKSEERFLSFSIYHTNETIVATHYISSKMTVFYVTRNDDETKFIFNKYLHQDYYRFEYRNEFNYAKRTEKLQFPSVEYQRKFEEIEKTLVNTDETNLGFYTEVIKRIQYTNTVLMNDNLLNYITPIVLTNNKYGVEKLESIREIIHLKSVTYK